MWTCHSVWWVLGSRGHEVHKTQITEVIGVVFILVFTGKVCPLLAEVPEPSDDLRE